MQIPPWTVALIDIFASLCSRAGNPLCDVVFRNYPRITKWRMTMVENTHKIWKAMFQALQGNMADRDLLPRINDRASKVQVLIMSYNSEGWYVD